MLNQTVSRTAFSGVSLEQLMASTPKPSTFQKRVRSRRHGVERVLRREGNQEIRMALRGEIDTLATSDEETFEHYEPTCDSCWAHPCRCVDMMCDDDHDFGHNRCGMCQRSYSRCECDDGDDMHYSRDVDYGYYDEYYYGERFSMHLPPMSPFASDRELSEFLDLSGGAGLNQAVEELNAMFGCSLDADALKLHDYFWKEEEMFNRHFETASYADSLQGLFDADDDVFADDLWADGGLFDSLFVRTEEPEIELPVRRGLFLELSGKDHRVKRIKARLGDCYNRDEDEDNDKRRLLARELHAHHVAEMNAAAESIRRRNIEVEQRKLERSMRGAVVGQFDSNVGNGVVGGQFGHNVAPIRTVTVHRVDTSKGRRKVTLAGWVCTTSYNGHSRHRFEPAN